MANASKVIVVETIQRRQFPDKAIYFTECSGSQSADPANTFSDTLK